jgi:hypothetical protein
MKINHNEQQVWSYLQLNSNVPNESFCGYPTVAAIIHKQLRWNKKVSFWCLFIPENMIKDRYLKISNVTGFDLHQKKRWWTVQTKERRQEEGEVTQENSQQWKVPLK